MSGNWLLNRVVVTVALLLIAGLAWGLIDSRSSNSRLRAENEKLQKSIDELEYKVEAAVDFAKSQFMDAEEAKLMLEAQMQEEAKKQAQ